MTPEEIELVKWISGVAVAIVAVVAPIAYWLHKDRREKERSRLVRWNDKVFKRWLNVFVARTSESDPEFRVPDPPNRRPGMDGVPLNSLPDFKYANTYLDDRHPEVSRRWSLVKTLLTKMDEAQGRYRAVIKEVVKREMKHHFPSLEAQMSRKDLQPNFYNIDVLADRVYGKSYPWVKGPKEPKFKVRPPTREEIEGTSVWIITDAQRHMAAATDKPPSVKLYERVLIQCAKDNAVVAQGRDFIESQDDFETAFRRFRDALQKVSVDIDNRYL